jgi:release factor glutamine methyltransferase
MAHTVSSLLAEVPDLADHEVRRLIQLATGLDRRAALGDPQVPDELLVRFRDLVERRRSGEPLQYIEGTVQFGPIELKTDRRALIPRPETERLWEISSVLIDKVDAPLIVDLCTGSGNLALAHKHRRPNATVVGVDLSGDAIALANDNAASLGLEVTFARGDLFAALPDELSGKVDLLVSNPPYIASAEAAELPTEIRNYEPETALLAGPEGTEVLARIAADARVWLRPGGWMVCEIGETQGAECLRLFAGLSPRIENDFAGRPRFVVGRAPQLPNVH